MSHERTTEALQMLISRLSPVEKEIYTWLRESFSIRWIAETTMRCKREIKAIAGRVYKTLEVYDQKELVMYYGTLNKDLAGQEPDLHPEELAQALASYNIEEFLPRTA